MKTLAIVGGAGFLGRALIARIDADIAVRCLDRAVFPGHAMCPPQFTSLVGSAHDPGILGQTLEGADAVWIRAGLLGGPQSVDPKTCIDYIRENTDMVASVLDACDRAGCGRVFYDSSEQVFGEDTDQSPAEPDTEPISLNFYGASKLIAEKLLRAWSMAGKDAERSAQIFRYSRIRTNDSRDAIFHMADAAMSGRPIRVIGDPEHALDFVDLDDVMTANLAVLNRAPRFEIYHVSSGRPISLLQLAVHIQGMAVRAGGASAAIEHIPGANGIVFEPRVLGLSWKDSMRRLGIREPKPLEAMIQGTLDRLKETK